MSSPALDLLRTAPIPDAVRRMTGIPKVMSLYAHFYSIGDQEGFRMEEMAIIDAWKDAAVAQIRAENRS